MFGQNLETSSVWVSCLRTVEVILWKLHAVIPASPQECWWTMLCAEDLLRSSQKRLYVSDRQSIPSIPVTCSHKLAVSIEVKMFFYDFGSLQTQWRRCAVTKDVRSSQWVWWKLLRDCRFFPLKRSKLYLQLLGGLLRQQKPNLQKGWVTE